MEICSQAITYTLIPKALLVQVSHSPLNTLNFGEF